MGSVSYTLRNRLAGWPNWQGAWLLIRWRGISAFGGSSPSPVAIYGEDEKWLFRLVPKKSRRQRPVGSTPTLTAIRCGARDWSKGTDCKSVIRRFESDPHLHTQQCDNSVVGSLGKRVARKGLWVRVPSAAPYGHVAQESRAPACHAGGQGFESPRGRQIWCHRRIG